MARFSLLFCFLWIFSSVPAQYTANQRQEIETVTSELVKKMMHLAEIRRYDTFAGKMIYTGRNPNRNLQDKVNFNDPHEKLGAINAANKMGHYLKKSALWHSKNFRIIEGFEKDLFRWDIEFTYLNGKTKTLQATFAKHKGEYLFCQME